MAAVVPITILQGATWTLPLAWQQPLGTPIADLTGWTALMQIRATADAATPLVSIETGDGIAIIGPSAQIILTITDEQTAALDIPEDTGCCSGDVTLPDGAVPLGVYDLILTSTFGTVTRLMEGPAYISPSVSRP